MITQIKNNKGFTLLELALVATIISFLALMAAPTFMQKNRSKAVNGFSEELNWTLEIIRRYYALNNNFPVDWNQLLNSNSLPRVPIDPFEGTVNLETDNTATPKICKIKIIGGVANTDYSNIILKRVPFAQRDTTVTPNTITIIINGYMNWLLKEIVYMGIHQDGDTVPKVPCSGYMENHIFTDLVALKSQNDGAIQEFKTWAIEDNNGNYIVHCEVYDDATTNSQNQCLIKVMEICH